MKNLSLARARKNARGRRRSPAISVLSRAISASVRPLFRADSTLEALIENVQTLTGQRGGDGAAVVMVTDSTGHRVPFYPDGQGGDTGGETGGGGSGEGDGGVTPATPTQPAGLVVNGGFSVVELDWNAPQYVGHSQTQIWRSPQDDLSLAVQVGSTAANIYSDPIDPVFEGYYWIRFVNSAGVAGPYNASAGTYVITQASTDDILDVINEEINDSPLIAELQAGLDGVEEEVKTIDDEGSQAFQNMWSVKASADGITAGIGIVAGVDADGNPVSQVAVAAGDFFVFDPNSPNRDGTMKSMLYVDEKYGVCMEEAIIEQATIQILNAQTIVADQVTAGIEIDSPDIKGGQIEIGNGFAVDSSGNMTANNAVLNDVTLNRVTANEGQFNNVTIGEDCVIEGTLSANQIKGDIVNAVGFSLPQANDGRTVSGTRTIMISDDQPFDRSVIIPAIVSTATSYTDNTTEYNPVGYCTVEIDVYWNDVLVASSSISQEGVGTATTSASLVHDLITGQGGVTLKVVATSSAKYGAIPQTTCSSICLMVAKKGSGGIVVS